MRRPVSRSARFVIRSAVAACLAAALLAGGSAACGLLPVRWRKADATGSVRTSLSARTVGLLRSAKGDVSLRWLCEGGVPDDLLHLFLDGYAKAGPRVSLSVVDTEADPDFAAAYTDAPLPDCSLIVEGGGRYQILSSDAFYYYTNDFVDQQVNHGQAFPLTADQLSLLLGDPRFASDVAAAETHRYFLGERLLTSAVDYVTSDAVPRAYVLTGHGEEAIPGKLLRLLRSLTLAPEPLDLARTGEIPADANCLLCFNPSRDLSESEADAVRRFLDDGGSALLVTSPERIPLCPRLEAIARPFGLSAERGAVVDDDPAGHEKGAPYRLLPRPADRHPVTYLASARQVPLRMPNAHAIAVGAPVPGVRVARLLVTSPSGRRVASRDSDETIGARGSYTVAAAASRAFINAEGMQDHADLVWFASAEAFADPPGTAAPDGNALCFAEAVRFVSPPYESPFADLPAREFPADRLNCPTFPTFFWGAVLGVLLPAGLFASAAVVRCRRRKR